MLGDETAPAAKASRGTRNELTPALQEHGFRPAGPGNWAVRDDVAIHVQSDIAAGPAVHTVEVYPATEDGLVDPSRRLGSAQSHSHEEAVRGALDEADVDPVDGDQS